MSWYLLEPRDPLMVRDGRPFGLDTDGARSLDFPPCSVTAGALRTRVGFAVGGGQAFGLSPTDARNIEVTGPLLARLRTKDGGAELLLPAPRDCVLFPAAPGSPAWDRHPLSPRPAEGERTSSLAVDLRPVSGGSLPQGKPAKDAPAFWRAATLRAWLDRPTGGAPSPLLRADTHPGLPHEPRTHVSIDPKTDTADDGKLFSTDGLRFVSGAAYRGAEGAFAADRLALLLRCDDARLRPGTLPLGGERRLSALTAAPKQADWLWPAPAVKGRARVALLTPAYFAGGAVPAQIGGAKVVAAAVGRPLTLSGWDIAAGGPKATRRYAPAGSVYWVEWGPGFDTAAWLAAVHQREISETDQDRKDGFGLAVVGVWE